MRGMEIENRLAEKRILLLIYGRIQVFGFDMIGIYAILLEGKDNNNNNQTIILM